MEVKVDGSMAWMVAAGGFFMHALVMGYLKSLGILLMEFQNYFGCSSAVVMLVTAATTSLISLLAPVHRLVTARLVSVRVMVAGSGVLSCLLLLLVFFCFNFGLWLACLGFGLGLCLSACYSSVICQVSECFERRRDLAIGVCFAGSSVGGMLAPFLFTLVTARFSVAGCCLLIGGYFLHLALVGALMPSRVTGRKQEPGRRVAGHCPKSVGLNARERRLLCLYACGSVFANLGYTGQYLVFPMLAAEHRAEPATIAAMLATQAAVDLAFRLGVGWFTDRFNWRRSFVMIVGTTAMGAACLLLLAGLRRPDASWQLASLFGYACVSGAFGGVYIAISTSVLVSFVGVDNLGLSHSLVCCCWALTVFPGHAGLGYLQDITGTFGYSMAAAGLAMLLSSLIIATERLVGDARSEMSAAVNGVEMATEAAEPLPKSTTESEA